MSRRAKYTPNPLNGQVTGEFGVLMQDPAENADQLRSFLEKPYNVTSLVQALSYSVSTNDGKTIAPLASNMANVINASESSKYPVELLIEKLLENSKLFSKCLSSGRPSWVNPALRLLTAIVNYRSGEKVDALLEVFDVTQKNLPKLAVPSKTETSERARCQDQGSVRHHFVTFWLQLNRLSPPLARKDCLTGASKVMANVFKYTAVYDNLELQELLLDFLDESILQERAYKKMTKCRLIGDWAISRLPELYSVSGIREKLQSTLLKMATDEFDGLVFADDKVWFKTSAGADVKVAERTFQVYNKLIYTLLINLKPWVDELQLDLVVKVIDAVPELLPAYNYHCFYTNGAHDSKLSSFYIGQSLLLQRLIQLPVPDRFIRALRQRVKSNISTSSADVHSASTDLPASNVMEAICPSQLTRSALTQGISSDSQLIRHINATLLVAIFHKYEAISKALSYDDNFLYSGVKNELRELLATQQLPDLGAVVGALNECKKTTNKLLLVNLLEVAQNYNRLLNEVQSVKLEKMNLGDTDADFKGIDLVILDSYLQITANTPEQSKWWTVSKGAKNTLFTSLLRMPYRLANQSNGSSAVPESKIAAVLADLITDTPVFVDYRSGSQSVLQSQAYALLSALTIFSMETKSDEEIDKICHLLDESIARCIRSPYKYIDAALEYSSQLSPFYIAVLEQAKFVPGEHDGLHKFLFLLTRCFFLINEPPDAMKKALDAYIPGIDTSFLTVSFDRYEQSLKGDGPDLHSVSQSIVSLPTATLNSKADSIIPFTDVDALALLDRCKSLVYNSKISLSEIKSLLTTLISKFGNYIVQKISTVADKENVSVNSLNFLDRKYWEALYLSTDAAEEFPEMISAKRDYAAGLINTIFYTIEQSECASSALRDYHDTVVSLLSSGSSSSSSSQTVLADSVWVLEDTDFATVLPIAPDSTIRDRLLALSINRDVALPSEVVVDIAINHLSPVNASLLATVRKDPMSISFAQVQSLLDVFEKTHEDELLSILQSFLVMNLTWSSELSQEITPKEAARLCESSRGLDFLEYLSESVPHYRDLVNQSATQGIESVISAGEVGGKPLRTYLRLAPVQSQSDVSKLLKLDDFKNNASLVFSQEFVRYMFLSNSSESIVRPWLHRATLYITKMFSEKENLPQQFLNFLESLEPLLQRHSVWASVPKTMVNSQLEMILSKKWVGTISILKYVICVLHQASSHVEEVKMMQIFLNNANSGLFKDPVTKEDVKVRFFSAVVAYSLFQCSPKKVSSSDIQKSLLKFYRGSTRPDDAVLKRLLVDMEAEIGVSWINYVLNWEFDDDGLLESDEVPSQFKLIEDSPIGNGLEVHVHNAVIKNTLDNFKETVKSEPVPTELTLTAWNQTLSDGLTKVDAKLARKDIDYDSEFILLLCVNNEELFKTDDNTLVANVSGLVDTGTLQLAVMNLANGSAEVRQIARRILTVVYGNITEQINESERLRERREAVNAGAGADAGAGAESVDDDGRTTSRVFRNYKENYAFKLFLGDLLNTLQEDEQIRPVILMMLSRFVPVLANPGHFMYEKVYRLLLGAPTFRTFEIPMFKPVMLLFTKDAHASQETDNTEDYYKRLGWFLDNLARCITCADDLHVLKRNSFFDTLLNLTASPFLHIHVHSLIVAILLQIVRIPGGGDMLVRTSGLLSFLENKVTSFLDGPSTSSLEAIRRDFNALQYQRVAIETRVACGNNKRTNEWCDDELDFCIRRSC